MQASIQDIHDLLLLGEEVTLSVVSENIYHNLRVALVKKHTDFRAYGISDDSLCSDWKVESHQATFWLGKPRRRAGTLFEIIHHGTLRTTLELNSQERRANYSSLSEAGSGTIDSSYSATEEQGQCSEEKS